MVEESVSEPRSPTRDRLAARLRESNLAAPLAVAIGEAAGERYPAPIETTAYQVVAEAIDDAVRRGASYAAVNAIQDEERLVVKVEDDGSERTSTMIHLDDRVGAVGGRLEVEATMLRAEIPCA